MRKSGRLKIGDHQNAIAIIALSQSNPLKAIAEFVENSIDAKAKNITILRGKEKGKSYIKIKDDGEGIPKNEEGIPNFQYVATHICDSIKRRLKAEGKKGIQGEFGIGLLSFWTVGEELFLTSAGNDHKVYQMRMRKGQGRYQMERLRKLFVEGGCELKITPLLPGIKHFSGEKIEWYLASELRDRIRTSGVQIRIIDRQARAEYRVEPRQFTGQLIHDLPKAVTPKGECYLEIYLTHPDPKNQIALCKGGTRVLENIASLEFFSKHPWNSGYFEGMVDAPFLNLTPGTRLGVIQDEIYSSFCEGLKPVETKLLKIIEDQKRAEEEKTSRDVLRSIQKALREALLALPEEEYDWFDIKAGRGHLVKKRNGEWLNTMDEEKRENGNGVSKSSEVQKAFFEFPGPLYKVKISPTSSIVPVGGEKNFRVICRDRHGKLVEENLHFQWKIVEGMGSFIDNDREVVTFQAPQEPTLVRIEVNVKQKGIVCAAEGYVTITDSLLPKSKDVDNNRQGLPGYTFQRAPGELWRSRYQADQNVVVINNAHRDFVFAAKIKTRKLRYISRLFSKELVHKNFPGLPPQELLERMVELSLYTEENL